MKSVTKDTFEQDVLKSEKTVLVDIWAEWCPPCLAMEPIIEAIAEETKEWAEVVKIDASSQMELVQELSVSALPTFIVFKGGEAVKTSTGATSKANLLKIMDQNS